MKAVIVSLLKRSLLLLVLLFFFVAAHAQSISPEEAKTLAKALTNSKADTAQINIILKLAKYQVFKPGENKTDLDSAANFIDQAESLNQKLRSKIEEGNIFLTRSFYLKEIGQEDKAKEATQRAVTILKNESDKNLAGEAYMELASYYDLNDSEALTQRIELVDSGVNCYAQSGNIQQKAASLQMLGDLHNLNGSSYIALQQLQASLDAYKSIHYLQVQGVYCLIGFIYSRLRDSRKALDNELLALKTAESVGDSSMQLCEIYNYLGEIQRDLNEKEKAIYYYDKALVVAEKHHDNDAIYLATTNIANIWTALNQPVKALDLLKSVSAKYEKPKSLNIEYNVARCYINSYCQLKQYENARPYANELLHMVNTLNMNDYANISSYAAIIRFYISAGEYDEARKYLAKHGELANKVQDFLQMSMNRKLWFMLDTSRHDYKAAVVHLLEFNRLNDSLFNETKSNQIEELQVQFETEKKENAIVAKDKDIQLLTKQSQLQQSSIEKSQLMRNWIIAGASMLLIIALLLYRQSSVRKKNNKIIKVKNDQLQHLVTEKEWLLKEIHHRTKNNLQIVMSLLNSQSAYIDNEPALTAIRDSQHRVHAMSLIHQKLYNSENLSSIDISFYIRELVSYLSDSFDTRQRIRFEFAMEQLEMDVSQAVPLGLILNEAITNSIKYAFPDGRNGTITISLASTALHHYLLIISDNGIGMPSHFNNNRPGSLGLNLMSGLSEDLDGNFSFENNNGTTVKISFVHDPGVKQPATLNTGFYSNS